MKTILFTLGLVISAVIAHAQSYTSYTFQVVNPCLSCCNATACISYTPPPTCMGPFQYAWVTPQNPTYPPPMSSWSAATCTTGLCDGTYTAVVIDPSGPNCTGTSSVTVTYNIGTSQIENQLNALHIQIYNENNLLKVLVNREVSFDAVVIRDCLGKEVVKLGPASRDLAVPLDKLAEGIYYATLFVKDPDLIVTKKFIR